MTLSVKLGSRYRGLHYCSAVSLSASPSCQSLQRASRSVLQWKTLSSSRTFRLHVFLLMIRVAANQAFSPVIVTHYLFISMVSVHCWITSYRCLWFKAKSPNEIMFFFIPLGERQRLWRSFCYISLCLSLPRLSLPLDTFLLMVANFAVPIQDKVEKLINSERLLLDTTSGFLKI